MDNQKYFNTMRVFDEYEKRFAEARACKKLSMPWEQADREEIVASAKRMLSYDEKLMPNVHNVEEISRIQFDGYSAIQLRYETWEKVYGVSSLFLPDKKEKLPLVFVCCGHGKEGRLTSSYQAMGHRLASMGIAALVIDNIGQGDRKLTAEDIDHWNAVSPFFCGLTLQGLIVMETIALIRYMKTDQRFDSTRFGACGNSGGGTLTMFLAALAPELSVISSSGYPSEISYILQKERRHCACNLLPGEAFEAEMWELYSVFAPKPLLLEGGESDTLIPSDLAYRNARKVHNSYIQLGASSDFSFKLTPSGHSWSVYDINLISKFLAQHLTGDIPEDITEMFDTKDIASMQVALPKDCLSTTGLCEKLSNIKVPEGIRLENIFVPVSGGKPINSETIQTDIGRGNLMRVFAQFECALYKSE